MLHFAGCSQPTTGLIFRSQCSQWNQQSMVLSSSDKCMEWSFACYDWLTLSLVLIFVLVKSNLQIYHIIFGMSNDYLYSLFNHKVVQSRVKLYYICGYINAIALLSDLGNNFPFNQGSVWDYNCICTGDIVEVKSVNPVIMNCC